MPSPDVIAVVGAVIVDQGRFLAARRRPERPPGGRWEFPGGKVQPGESPRDALVREIREELGVEIVVGELVDRTTTMTAAGPIDLACYWASLLGPAPTASTDHDELRWVERGDLRQLQWAEPDLPAVSRIETLPARAGTEAAGTEAAGTEPGRRARSTG